MINPVFFSIISDIVNLGFHEDSFIYGYSAYVRAEDAVGRTVLHYVGTERYEEDIVPKAEKLADALNARLKLGKLPVRFSEWVPGDPLYGSEAYVVNMPNEVAREKKEAEEESFPF